MKSKERLKYIYLKLVRADDTPHHIALGFAIGIFYGLIPFVGIIFTIVTAVIFRANKVASLIGCFVTNTWMAVLLTLPSVKIGAKIFGLDWRIVWSDIKGYLLVPDVRDIFRTASRDVLIPTLTGFAIIALSMAIVSYAIALFFILKYRNAKKINKDSD